MHNVAFRALRAVLLGSGCGFNGDRRESLQMHEAQAFSGLTGGGRGVKANT